MALHAGLFSLGHILKGDSLAAFAQEFEEFQLIFYLWDLYEETIS